MECPDCYQGLVEVGGSSGDWPCRNCIRDEYDRPTGRIPAPILPSHQPITEVTLTIRPEIGDLGELEAFGTGGPEVFVRERWPSVKKWNMPAADAAAVANYERGRRRAR